MLPLLAPIPASAHVTVQPKTGNVGSQEYTVRAPMEKADVRRHIAPPPSVARN
jgi:uncharacterized protein YcnI